MEGIKLNDEAVRFRSTDIYIFPTNFIGADGSPYPGGDLQGSEGSAVDHLGFSFPNLQAKLESLEQAGVDILQQARDVGGKFKYAIIRDPWGTKIEVMQDPELYGFHHAHVVAKDPAATIAWYQEVFGGEITRFKGLDALPAIRYGGMWLMVAKTERNFAKSEFRSIDHLGWGFKNLAHEMARLKRKGVTVVADLHDYLGTNYAYIESPEGALIEFAETN